MINAVTGVPGEGKTNFAVRHIILHELMYGNRPIYGNVAWDEEEVRKFCLKFDVEVDTTRLHTLEEEQIPRFWEHCPRNCLIVLDEVGEFFNAAAFKTMSSDVGTYARQHRKLGHEVYLVVQTISHLYKQLRDMCFEEIRIMNLNNRRIGPFRLPKMFLARWVVMSGREINRTKLYGFDKSVFKTYRTLETVGGILNTAPEVHHQTTKKKFSIRRIFRDFRNKLSDNWKMLFLLGIMALVIFMPARMIATLKKTQKEGMQENEKTGEKPNKLNQGIAGAIAPSNVRSERKQDIHSYYGGRYDSSAIRGIRLEDTH